MVLWLLNPYHCCLKSRRLGCVKLLAGEREKNQLLCELWKIPEMNWNFLFFSIFNEQLNVNELENICTFSSFSDNICICVRMIRIKRFFRHPIGMFLFVFSFFHFFFGFVYVSPKIAFHLITLNSIKSNNEMGEGDTHKKKTIKQKTMEQWSNCWDRKIHIF